MTPMVRFIIYFFFLCFMSSYSWASECGNTSRLSDYKGKKVLVKDDVLLFATNILKIDIDGSKKSYGMNDQGVEGICNGLSPISPKRCQNAFQRRSNGCFKHCVAKFKEWRKKSGKVKDLKLFMRSIGLGGAQGSIPQVQRQAPPNEDMFVSHTSVKYGPWKRGDPSTQIKKQSSQIEPFEVPFFVIPSKFRKGPWFATPGDLGVAVHAQDPSRYSLFVVGDIGGNLDEGSAKLQELLRGHPLKPRKRTNVFGKKVDDYGNISYTKFSTDKNLDLRIAIFRNTSSYKRNISGPVLILQDITSQKEILSFIQIEGKKKLDAFGGARKIVSCTD